jgi:hypothetical protein
MPLHDWGSLNPMCSMGFDSIASVGLLPLVAVGCIPLEFASIEFV